MACRSTYRQRRKQRLVAKVASVNIFVTGAAGLLGGALVAALTKAGHGVVGLVHRAVNICGNDGVMLSSQHFDSRALDAGKLKVLHGDVRLSGLGLDSGTLTWLDRHIDVVVHCAALVKFDADMSELEAVNVDGTQHVAQLFSNARFIHVSTAYVCGLRNGQIAETPCDPGGLFGNGYEQSKARAEALLHQLRPGAIVARPSIIVGEWASGRIRSFDTIYRAFKFIAEGRIANVPISAMATLNFVPIDYVVAGICDLAEKAGAAPQIVHLASRKAVSAGHFLTLIGTVPGLRSPLMAPWTGQYSEKLGMAERLAQPYWGYFRRHPEFATRALTQFSGRDAPDMDDAALMRQISYCVEADFIRAYKYGS